MSDFFGELICGETMSTREDNEDNEHYRQWMSNDETVYMPCPETKDTLPFGMYKIGESQEGFFFQKIPIKTEGLLRLPNTESSEVFEEIVNFWEKEEIYKQHDLTYKRGILLWGDPGTGKTSTLQMVVEDVSKRGGICIVFEDPYTFSHGMRLFRKIQPETPVVVIMEDIDSIVQDYSETEVLNIINGMEEIRKVVFLATTNYPEKLGDRIFNRPSRFDKRFEIKPPNEEDRKAYISSINKLNLIDKKAIDKWAKDTDNLTLSHIKELFVSVALLGHEYNQTLNNLKKMKKNPSEEGKRNLGF